MWEDPIVAEVRRAGEELAERAGHDLDRFIELLRELERRHCRSTRPGVPAPPEPPTIGSADPDRDAGGSDPQS